MIIDHGDVFFRNVILVLEKKCKEKNVKVSYRFLKKDERFTDGPYKVPEKGGYVVRVEHEKLGFQYTDESLNAAIRLMVDHLHYTEITYKNIPKENNTQWHHVLDGECSERAKGNSIIIDRSLRVTIV